MIEVEGIYKSFDGKEVLHDISFKFLRGKTNMIIGKSGSGKSVLTKCIVGLLEADKGVVKYDERNFTSMPLYEKKEIRQEIGMLFQGGALFDSMTVEDNILFPLKMNSDLSKKEMLDRVNFCLKRVNLEGTNNKFSAELSGGMRKRVGIARAIAPSPKYLFCDEPNSGLDPQTSRLIDDLISDITVEFDITTVLVSHDMNSVMKIGDNICFIFNGRKSWEGNSADILKNDNEELNDFVRASGLTN